MKTNTARKITKKADVPVLQPDLLTPADVLKLERIAQLKAELEALENAVKPRIEATVRTIGACEIELGGRVIRLLSSTRESTSWKSIAESAMEPAQIAELKPLWTTLSTSYSAKVVS